MKSLKAKELIKILEQHGFSLSRQKASHLMFVNEDKHMVTVPIHGKNKEIPIGTFLAIIKQSKIAKEKFVK